MLAVFLIVLREIAELLLILEAMRAYACSIGRPDLTKQMRWGVVAGCAASAAIVAAFATASIDPRLAALLTIAFAISIFALALGMLSSRPELVSSTHASLDRWMLRTGRAAPLGLALLAAFATVREVTEIAMFSRSLVLRIGIIDVAAGAVLGLLASALLAGVYLSARARINLAALFGVSSLVLCLLAIQLLLSGIAELLAAFQDGAGAPLLAFWLPGGSGYPWLCAVLMLPPLWIVARRWWRGASSTHTD